MDEWDLSAVNLLKPVRKTRGWRSFCPLGVSILSLSIILAVIVGVSVWIVMTVFTTRSYESLGNEVSRNLVVATQNTFLDLEDVGMKSVSVMADYVAEELQRSGGGLSDDFLIGHVGPLLEPTLLAALYVGLPNGRILGFERGPFTLVYTNETTGQTIISLADSTTYQPVGDPLVVLPTFDSRSRDWYKLAAALPIEERERGAWTPVYTSAGSPYLSLTYSKPVVTSNGTLSAIIACDISTQLLSSYLLTVRVGTSGRGATWIFDDNGFVFATGNTSILGELKAGKFTHLTEILNRVVNGTTEFILGFNESHPINEYNYSDYRRAPSLFGKLTSIVSEFNSTASETWIVSNERLASAGSTRLFLVAAFPASELYDEVSNAKTLSLAVTLGVVVPVCAALAAVFSYAVLARPLHEMADGLDRVTTLLEFDDNPAIKQGRNWCTRGANLWEITSMRRSYERLQISLASFAKYVPRDVVKNLLASRTEATLGAQPLEVTCFFSDIAGFTSITEVTPPKVLISWLREYFEEMTSVIEDEKGVTADFIGDAVVAYWNAVLPVDRHACHACEASLKQQERLVELRASWGHRALPDGHIRIGLNTGSVLGGNIGSESRLKFTVAGESADLAEHLEDLNKEYGTEIMLSEYTWMQPGVQSLYVCRCLDIITEGNFQEFRVFELLGRRGSAPVWMLQAEMLSFKAFDCLKTGDLAGCRSFLLSLLGVLHTRSPHDDKGVLKVLARLEAMRE